MLSFILNLFRPSLIPRILVAINYELTWVSTIRTHICFFEFFTLHHLIIDSNWNPVIKTSLLFRHGKINAHIVRPNCLNFMRGDTQKLNRNLTIVTDSKRIDPICFRIFLPVMNLLTWDN